MKYRIIGVLKNTGTNVTIILEANNSELVEDIASKEEISISKIVQCSNERVTPIPLWAAITGAIVSLALIGNIIALILTRLNSAQMAQKNQVIIDEFKEQTELQRKQLENATSEIALLKGTVSLQQIDIPKVRSNAIKPEKDWTPDKILNVYFEAPTWQDRLPLVLDPDATYKIMSQNYDRLFSYYKPVKYYHIHSCQTETPKTGQNILVEVDIEGEPFVPYCLLYTDKGWRIDWAASHAQWGKNYEARIKRKYGDSYELEVKILKNYQIASFASFDLEIANKSNVNVSFWGIDCIAYDANGNYIAKTMTNGSNLNPNTSTINSIHFSDVPSEKINNVKIALEQVKGVSEQGYEIPMVERLFVLEQIE